MFGRAFRPDEKPAAVSRLATALGVFGIGILSVSANVWAGDFPQFRGPDGTGIVAEANPPTEWTLQKGLAWKIDLPGTGWSQPIVVGKLLFVTTAVSDQLKPPKDMFEGARDPASIPLMGNRKAPNIDVKWQVIALDAVTGETQWVRTVAEGKPQFSIHPSNTYATETPCADGDRVYAYFGATGTVTALDHSGKPVWNVELGAYPISSGFGTGSSPVLYDQKIFVNCFNEKKAFVIALDAVTGREIWRENRAKPGSAWASPLVWKNSKRTEIVACGDKLVTAHDPATGEELWRLGGVDTAFAPSPAADGDTLILGASSPFSSSPMYAIRAGASGDISLKRGQKSSDSVAWYQTKGKIGMASPVASQGYVYFASSGILTCYDVATGQRAYMERLPGGKTVAASPALIGDKLLVLDESGGAIWVKCGPKFEIVGQGEIDDTFWASPVAVNSRMYLRGVKGLYCLTRSAK
jgi:outer membrane protein assembly factor BamB